MLIMGPGLALIDLTLMPLVILEAAMLSLHFWIWRGVKNRAAKAADFVKEESEFYKPDDYNELMQKSAGHKVNI